MRTAERRLKAVMTMNYGLITLLFGSGVLVTVCKVIWTKIRQIEQAYAPIYVKENFENMWKQYHNLGVNGVMDGIHEAFMALPTEPPEDRKD